MTNFVKVSRAVCERNEERREQYRKTVEEEFAGGGNKFVFVDESVCNRRTSIRSWGWSPIGSRSRRRDTFLRGKRYDLFLLSLFYHTVIVGTLFFLRFRSTASST